jgi:hypothetical protein
MFIRWQSRKRTKPAFGRYRDADGNRLSDTHWQAVLVESKRVDGKPRQQHVASIVGFSESQTKIDMQRCYIWKTVDERLKRLSNRITQADRERIEAAVAARVPRPTPEEEKEAARGKARDLGWKYLSEEHQALLADEKEQLLANGSSLARAINGVRCCSFCGKSELDAHTLVSRGESYICDECIEKAATIVAERKAAPLGGCGE